MRKIRNVFSLVVSVVLSSCAHGPVTATSPDKKPDISPEKPPAEKNNSTSGSQIFILPNNQRQDGTCACAFNCSFGCRPYSAQDEAFNEKLMLKKIEEGRLEDEVSRERIKTSLRYRNIKNGPPPYPSFERNGSIYACAGNCGPNVRAYQRRVKIWERAMDKWRARHPKEAKELAEEERAENAAANMSVNEINKQMNDLYNDERKTGQGK